MESKVSNEDTVKDFQVKLMTLLKTAQSKAIELQCNSHSSLNKLLEEFKVKLESVISKAKTSFNIEKEQLENDIELVVKSISTLIEQEESSPTFTLPDMSESSSEELLSKFKEKAAIIKEAMPYLDILMERSAKLKQKQEEFIGSLSNFERGFVNGFSNKSKQEIEDMKELERLEVEKNNITIRMKLRNEELKAEYITLMHEREEMKEKIERLCMEAEQLMKNSETYDKLNLNLLTMIDANQKVLEVKTNKIKRLSDFYDTRKEISTKMIEELKSDIKSKLKADLESLKTLENNEFMQSDIISFFDKQFDTLYIYDLYKSRIINMRTLHNITCTDFDSIQIGNTMFVVGGFDMDKGDHLESTTEFKIIHDKDIVMYPRENINQARSNHKLVALNYKTIYCIGGKSNKKKSLKTCEIYDITQDKWTMGPIMIHEHFLPTTTCFQCSEIYVFGGGLTLFSNNIEMLCPMKNAKWEQIKIASTDCTIRRGASAISLYENNIYIFGGLISDTECTDEIFEFNVVDKVLTKSQLKLERKAKFILNNPIRQEEKIYIVEIRKKELHIYDIIDNQWSVRNLFE